MANSIRSYPNDKRSSVVQNRLANGTREIILAAKEHRTPVLGLGYWGALAARKHGI